MRPLNFTVRAPLLRPTVNALTFLKRLPTRLATVTVTRAFSDSVNATCLREALTFVKRGLVVSRATTTGGIRTGGVTPGGVVPGGVVPGGGLGR